jgi:hypothetical protein
MSLKSKSGKLLSRNGHLCTTCCGAYTIGEITSFYEVQEGYPWQCVRYGRTETPVNFLLNNLAPSGYYWRIGNWGYNNYPGNEYWYHFTWNMVPKVWGNEGTAQGTVGVQGDLSSLTTAIYGTCLSDISPYWDMYPVYVEISPDGISWPAHP